LLLNQHNRDDTPQNCILMLVSHYSQNSNEKLNEQPGLNSWLMH